MTPTEQLQDLAAVLPHEHPGLRTELTTFTGGGAMLDVRLDDGRLFVLSYGPSFGFGVDEVLAEDEWRTDYRFVVPEFTTAADRLRELVNQAEPVAAPLGLNLVVIYAHDLNSSKAFYDRLGLRFQPEQHGNGPRHFAATVAGTTFEIYPCGDRETRSGIRLGFQVASVERAVKALESAGARVISVPQASPWGQRAVVEDPDGYRVELVQRA